MKTLAIVTPVYNRANLINTVYESLKNQTNKDFVWYVIDDGSSDNIVETMEKISVESEFPIVFKSKENGGKHTALNLALDLVQEELILILDSDDKLTTDAVDTIVNGYDEIKDKNDFCGLGYLKCKKNGQVVGREYTKEGLEDTFINERINNNVYGDKCEVFKTNVFKEYKFPVFSGENFISENVVWCKMALNYKMKFFNKAIYVCEYLTGGLSDNVKRRLFNNPKGASECYLNMSSKKVKLKYRLKYTIAFIIYSFAAKIKLREQFKKISSKCLYILGFVPAWLIYLKKKKEYRK